MSARKFATITGDLLSRKGEAGPSADRFSVAQQWSLEPPPMPDTQNSSTAPATTLVHAIPASQSVVVSDKAAPTTRIAVRVSDRLHFRMRVAAAQLQMSRQSLISAALEHYLSTVCAAGLPECKCLSSGSGCACAG